MGVNKCGHPDSSAGPREGSTLRSSPPSPQGAQDQERRVKCKALLYQFLAVWLGFPGEA